MANKAKQESPEQEIPQFDPSSLRASLRTRGLATGSTAARQAKAADPPQSSPPRKVRSPRSSFVALVCVRMERRNRLRKGDVAKMW